MDLSTLLSLSPEQRKEIRVVLTGGVFDILHVGHVHTLAEAKKHGDVLVVVLARDDMIARKGRKLIHSQDYRAKMVEALKPVDIVVLGSENPDDIVKQIKPNVIVYGYDQQEFLKPEGVEIIKLKEHLEPEKFKTNKIIKELGL